MHVDSEGDYVNGVKTPAVGIAKGHDLEGHHLHVRVVNVLQVVVPHLIYGVTEELAGAAFGCLVAGKVEIGGQPLRRHQKWWWHCW